MSISILKNGQDRQLEPVELYADYESDIVNLPTSIERGLTGINKVPLYSKCSVVETGNIYMLNSDNNWVLFKTGGKSGEQVQSDWNVNDEKNPAYVKNRPFYTADPVGKIIFSKDNYLFQQTQGKFVYQDRKILELSNADTIIVNWDKTNYTCKKIEIHDQIDYIFFGNASIYEPSYTDTKEPFCIVIMINYNLGRCFSKDVSSEKELYHEMEIEAFFSEHIQIPDEFLKTKPGKVFLEGGEIFNDYKNNIAINNGHAEGSRTFALGRDSHAEGTNLLIEPDVHIIKAKIIEGNIEERYYILEGDYTKKFKYKNGIIVEINKEKPGSGLLEGVFNNIELINGNTKFCCDDKKYLFINHVSVGEECKFLVKTVYRLQGGLNTIAFGPGSHAEGRGKAFGMYSHAESSGKAYGNSSHAENFSETIGDDSHAEGYWTTSYGENSHSEGWGTKAIGKDSHVEGKWNIPDTNDGTEEGTPNEKYAHIVGNGEPKKLSNAHTLDWQGNAWYAGDIKIGGKSYDDPLATALATKTDIQNLEDNKADYKIKVIAQDRITQNDAREVLNFADQYEGRLIEFLTNGDLPNKCVATGRIMTDANNNSYLITYNRDGTVTQWSKETYEKHNFECRSLINEPIVDLDNLTIDIQGEAPYMASVQKAINKPTGTSNFGVITVIAYAIDHQIQTYIDAESGCSYRRIITGTADKHAFSKWQSVLALSSPNGTKYEIKVNDQGVLTAEPITP